jgi:hypothetical protein
MGAGETRNHLHDYSWKRWRTRSKTFARGDDPAASTALWEQRGARRFAPVGFFFGSISVTIPLISERRAESDMPTAIEQIVNVFVSLGNRWRLEDMKLQRERAVIELPRPTWSERTY